MKIAVLVKQIPDTDNIKIDPKTGNLKREGSKTKINPIDLNVIEAALELKEKYNAHVSAISMGPPMAKDVLMKAMALGCDDAYLLSDRAFGGADSYATAYTLAKAIQKIGDVDLVITGRNSDDGDTAQVGPAVAAFLDAPQVTLATSVDVRDGSAYCTRDIGSVVETVRVTLPAVVAVCKDINEPKYALPANIFGAKDKPYTVWGAADIEAAPDMIGVPGSPSSTKRVIEPPKTKLQTKYYTGSTEAMAAQIVDDLAAKHLI